MPDFPSAHIWMSHRVSYGETDAMGVLYHAEYLHIFERSRNAYIRACGMSYRVAEERGLFLPVREAFCRYRVPARYDDLIRVRAGITQWGRASLSFTYEIYDEAERVLLTTGNTQHACVDASGRPMAVPDWFRVVGQSLENAPGFQPAPESVIC